MFQPLLNVWHRLVGGRSLLAFALAFAGLGLWFFYDSADSLSGYTAARKQVWISPERISYINKMDAEVTQLERELDPLVEKLSRAPEPVSAQRGSKAQEQAQAAAAAAAAADEVRAASLRAHRAAVRDKLRAVKHAHNEELAGEQAALEAALTAARAALEAERRAAP